MLTAPLVEVVALKASLSPFGSLALTVPVTAPVLALGVPRLTEPTTGGWLFTTAAAVTWGAGEDGRTWRRVAASTAHDTGESAGPAGVESGSGAITEPTTRRSAVTA